MDALSLTQATSLIFAALMTAVAALILVTRTRRDAAPSTLDETATTPEIVFLFDGDTLVDASPAAIQLLNATPPRGSDISRLVGFLAPRFPDLHDMAMASKELDALDLISSDGLTRLLVGVGGGRMRMRLQDTAAEPRPGPDRHTYLALCDELAVHRQIEATMPLPVWRQLTDGRVTWANAAYMDLARQSDMDEGCENGLARVFNVGGPAAIAADGALREQVKLATDAEPLWFDCIARPHGSEFLFAAIPADRILQAERNLRNFVDTLTQTFAHLDVGLAIFDRSRRLTLFNPALSELLGLPPEYLISHPSLFQFLDQLRNQQVMPEPKNYRNWRQQMSELEAAAVGGSYSETWALTDGRTYRVTGRPHPDGAVAFLFEDISTEISLSRQVRTDLQTSQAVFDGLDEAIAVFSPAGYLTLSNEPYAEMWDCDASTTLGEISFLDATRRWQELCAPTPIWGDARDFAATLGERSNWTAEVRLLDGRRLACRFEALPGGATLAAFTESAIAAFAPSQARLEPARA